MDGDRTFTRPDGPGDDHVPAGVLDTTPGAVLDRRDVIIVEGPEAASYLHGQLSQNVQRLAVGESAWSLLLAPQGRIDAWHRITRVGEETFWLDTDEGAGPGALQRLEWFKLRTKATFALLTMPRVALRGAGLPMTEELSAGADGAVIAFDWPGVTGVDLLGSKVAPPEGIPLVPSEALMALDIRHGIPAMGAELGEKTIPAEADIVERSVDFAKGCYVGQELVARVDSRGNNTPRKVRLVRLDGDVVPSAGTEVVAGGESIGTITRAAMGADGSVVASASIKRGHEPPLSVEIAGADGALTGQI